MIVEYIRYTIAEPDRPDFEAAYGRAALALQAAPQCVDYELARCEEEPGSYILRIRWTSTPDHLEGFRKGEHFPPFFAEIRPYFQAIQEMRHYEVTDVVGTGGSTPTLYEWAGGAEAFDRLFTRFYEHVAEDPDLAPVFAGMDAHHAQHVAAWLGEVFGGPSLYSSDHGGHKHMASRHLGRNITDAQRRRWINLLMDTADEVGLPADPEFRAVFAYYLEWGTRMALIYSGPNPPPLPETPMPTWHWNQTPPYLG
ncbi:group II truncated hemoglobin [Yinghuangia seranimata]|uniref:group II truncated hemoglobin n=1 Tax=Yinghuangia seranimata TaxID=408067 RepID=UPI00248C71B9|nr:antibiotic biosynthesis monooxygenase [Yinghuangia seranimata]MDI2132551.1 antibiotic biosynthesis monooxygenase [Yinghuangia seranimata]